MNVPFSFFLALRYLKPKRTFVWVINLISTAGVSLGIMALIVVIAVMTGFDLELRRTVLGFNPHLLITNDRLIKDWRALDAKVEKTPHVVATAPFVQGPVIIEFNGRRSTPIIRGIDVEREDKVTHVRQSIKEGSLDLEMDANGNSDKCVLGRELANELGVYVGDKVTIYSPGNLSDLVDQLKKAKDKDPKAKTLDQLEQMILPAELTVTGIFESGSATIDAEFVLVSLNVAQELYGLHDELHGLAVRTDDPYQVEAVKEKLLSFLEPPLDVRTWIDQNKRFFDAIRVERNVMFIILMIIVIVAAFGITSTLITVTVQKTREIGIMKALGARTSQIIWVFMAQGMVVGLVGTLAGLGLGMALLRWRNEFKEWLAATLHIEIFPSQIYQFSSIPAEVVPHDVLVICVSGFIICSIAALIPAFAAARLDPVKALRYE